MIDFYFFHFFFFFGFFGSSNRTWAIFTKKQLTSKDWRIQSWIQVFRKVGRQFVGFELGLEEGGLMCKLYTRRLEYNYQARG